MHFRICRWQHPVVILLIAAHFCSCHKWVMLDKPEALYIIEDKPQKIELELQGGEKYIMYLPFVQGDSLFGGNAIHYYGQSMIPADTFGVALKEIVHVRERQGHPLGKNVALLTTIVLLGGLLLTLLFFYSIGAASEAGPT